VGEVLKAGDRGQGTGDSTPTLAVTGGTVWTEEGPQRADVLVAGEQIAAVEPPGSLPATDSRIDASGLHVLPGFIDVHVHIDDEIGRFVLADDFPSGSRAAIETGVTTLAAFATQRPGESLCDCAARYLAKGAGRSSCDFTFHLTPTHWPWPWDEVAALVARGFHTFKLYTTYREAGLYSDWSRLEEVMPKLGQLGARLLLHCEDDDLLAAIDPATLTFGDPHSHTRARPEGAEVEAIRRALELAERTGCPLHVVHVSTAAGAELVVGARRRSAATCETGPQYLLLDDGALVGADGHRFLCTPPLRNAATRARMEDLAVAGAFDLFATDHCAFRRDDKDNWDGTDYREVPNGLAGIGALVPLLHDLLISRHGLPPGELALRLAANPAKLLGLYPRKGVIRPGSDADLVLVRAEGSPRTVRATWADAHDPWSARTTHWDVRAVLRRGEVVARDNRVRAGAAPSGRALVERGTPA
jgi:dihydropyrimidinase